MFRTRRSANHKRSPRIAKTNRTARRRKLLFESLEVRNLLAMLTVTSAADSGAGTLRDAISVAASNSEADIIEFSAGLTGATIDLTTVGHTAQGPSGLAILDDDVTIDATAAPGLSISQSGGEKRLFYVDGDAALTLQSITLTGGVARGDIGGDGSGGAVFSAGTLVSIDSLFWGNQAFGADDCCGGGGGGGGGGLGGAIYNASGSVSVEGTTIDGNSGVGGRGSDGECGGGGGEGVGAIYNQSGDLTINHSTLSNNTGTGGQGGDGFNNCCGPSAPGSEVSEGGPGGRGVGAITNSGGEVSITSSTLNGNSGVAGPGGGATFARASRAAQAAAKVSRAAAVAPMARSPIGGAVVSRSQTER